jgi:hypothetical protein
MAGVAPPSTVVSPGVGEPVGALVADTAEAVGPVGGKVGSVPGAGDPFGTTTERGGIPGPADGVPIECNTRATTIAMTSPKTMPITVWRYRGSSDRMKHLPLRSKRADSPGLPW